MLKRMWEYAMLEPYGEDELPDGVVQYEIHKEPMGRNQYYGNVIYSRPLTDKEVDKFNLDGPLPVWV